MKKNKVINEKLVVIAAASVLALSACAEVEQIDYSIPYEYIDMKGFGTDWSSLEHNSKDISLEHFTFRQKNYFRSGKSCIQYLESISEDGGKAIINYYNFWLAEGDIPARHIRMQCVLTVKPKSECTKKVSRNYLTSPEVRGSTGITFEEKKERADIIGKAISIAMRLADQQCRPKVKVGNMREFSLE